MSVLNEAFIDRARGLFASVQIARVTRLSTGAARVVLCSGGHPPALQRHNATVTPRTTDNILIGARRGMPYDDLEFQLAPGDALVLYTDGVSEAGRPHALVAEQGLIADNSAGIIDAISRAVRARARRAQG